MNFETDFMIDGWVRAKMFQWADIHTGKAENILTR